MSVLLEVMAALVGKPIGVYRQMSNNLHAYLDAPRVPELLENPFSHDYYERGMPTYDLVDEPSTFLDECDTFCRNPGSTLTWYTNLFFVDVAQPMYMLWITRDRGWLERIKAVDWQLACRQWLDRRVK
jgi:hypothetical protein